MFESFTKIVVIGSNVTRRAGPRIGSIGFLHHDTSARRNYHFGHLNLVNAYDRLYCTFTRYGYETSSRIETIAVCILTPSLFSNQNPKKAINAAIEQIAHYTNKTPLLLVAPVIGKLQDNVEMATNLYVLSNCYGVPGFIANLFFAKSNMLHEKTSPVAKYIEQFDALDEISIGILHTLQKPCRTAITNVAKRITPETYNTVRNVLLLANTNYTKLYKRKPKRPTWYYNKKGPNKTFSSEYELSDFIRLFDDWQEYTYSGLYYNSLKGLRTEIINRGIAIINK